MIRFVAICTAAAAIVLVVADSAAAYEENDDWPTFGYCPGSMKKVRDVSVDCGGNAGQRGRGGAGHRGAQGSGAGNPH